MKYKKIVYQCVVLKSCLSQPDFVTLLFEVASGFNLLNLNDTEIGLFTGIVLATSGNC